MLKFLLLFILVSCSVFNKAPERKVPTVQDVQNNPTYMENRGSKDSETTTTNKVKLVEVTATVNFTNKDIKFLRLYENKMNNILASDCFKSFMLKRDLIQTNGRTKQEVVNHIRTTTAKVRLKRYWRYRGPVGYTYPNTDMIWQNTYHHKNFGQCKAASNLAHEGTHKIGYGHDYKRTKRRPYSVPYSVNAAFNYCCKD